MSSTVGSRLALLAFVIMLLAACGGGGGTAVRTAEQIAVQRFDDAVALTAKALGKTTTEVAAGIKGKLPAATLDDLVAQAERTAARTAQLERLAAQEAQAAQRQRAMVDTIYGATCEWIDGADELASAPEDQRWARFQVILVEKLVEHTFTTEESDVMALIEDIQELWASVSDNSTRALPDIALDLGCFAS